MFQIIGSPSLSMSDGICFKFSTAAERVSRPGIEGGLKLLANIN
jgi:hypothetical protein